MQDYTHTLWLQFIPSSEPRHQPAKHTWIQKKYCEKVLDWVFRKYKLIHTRQCHNYIKTKQKNPYFAVKGTLCNISQFTD